MEIVISRSGSYSTFVSQMRHFFGFSVGAREGLSGMLELSLSLGNSIKVKSQAICGEAIGAWV